MEQNQIDQSIRLKKLIKALNLNQSSFARSLGMTQPNISRMVSGSSNISVEVLNRIKDRYRQVNLHWLLAGEGEMFFEEPSSPLLQVKESPEDTVVKGKGRLEELEERVARLEEVVSELKSDLLGK
jgi:transcriptional regulator with XRE-family HTH domain